MTTQKNTSSVFTSSVSPIDDDDYYAGERKKIAEEAQKARRIHEEVVQTHITAMIPYYDDASDEITKILLLTNNLLIHRFDEVGMIYWGIFRTTPEEMRDYRDIFGSELSEDNMEKVIEFFTEKKEEAETIIDIGFDEETLPEIPKLEWSDGEGDKETQENREDEHEYE